MASEVTGRLREVRVEEGQQVHSGQVLAVLDSSVIDREVTMLQARLASSQSAAQAAAADLADAQDTLARTTKLSATGFLSTASLNHDRRRVDSLHAQLARGNSDIVAARADTARLQAQRGQYEIRAPFSGVVVDRNAQSGEIVSPISGAGGFTRTGICTIVDMDSLEIQADINEAFIGQVHEGQTVDAILDAYPKQVIAARVLAIIPTVNRDKASVRVRIAFLNNDRRVLPDMAVKVSFNQSTTTRE
ncbi:Acriflavin resistance protein [Janthinobacterium sp. CG23_2]|nr:Acriflavin resistance protein [Janthinobacterium sp. CG23_2]CUU26884.1 Acriflavin resistance protein [Janthinobacterium sp. CG23_2]